MSLIGSGISWFLGTADDVRVWLLDLAGDVFAFAVTSSIHAIVVALDSVDQTAWFVQHMLGAAVDWTSVQAAFTTSLAVLAWFYQWLPLTSWARSTFEGMFIMIPICICIRCVLVFFRLVMMVLGWIGRIISAGIGGAS